jgi:ribosomal protein L29
MADLNSQNYKMFVDTRDRFRAKIKTMVQKLQSNEERIAKVKKAIAEI